jgi:hypothetical protein
MNDTRFMNLTLPSVRGTRILGTTDAGKTSDYQDDDHHESKMLSAREGIPGLIAALQEAAAEIDADTRTTQRFPKGNRRWLADSRAAAPASSQLLFRRTYMQRNSFTKVGR